MQAKRQFKGTKAPRLFFDRRVRTTGDTKSLSLGKVLPANWYYVRVEVTDRDANSITIKITRLLETQINASDNKTDTGDKQDA